MGTKNNPGKYDCYDKAGPDEPMFTLLARDKTAPVLVRIWAIMRRHEVGENEKSEEARKCAREMEIWKSEREKENG